ncbi:MAG: hypothetical protein D3924_02545 [Candidatus Electrothrix sp. AR4]|nr:hypothetical protein [Candidatus Electrothrix sp. AR4]MCI5221575.1 hypothetical protein [Candidatus Electrothrix sp. AR4]
MNSKSTMTLNILAAAFTCALYTNTAFSANQSSEINMLEAAENVEYVSQKIAKAYFYKQQGVRPDHAEKDLKDSVAKLKKDITILQQGMTGDKEEKNIAIFLGYTRDELLSTLSKPYTKENGALMLDYSESMLEGAEFIAHRHLHEKNPEEVMLVTAEQILFLLERINKYYIANKAGFKDYNNVVQLKQAVTDIESHLAKINAYKKYPENVHTSIVKINEFWPIAKEFYIDVQKGALPVIVLASTEKLEKEVKVIERYHHKAAGGK